MLRTVLCLAALWIMILGCCPPATPAVCEDPIAIMEQCRQDCCVLCRKGVPLIDVHTHIDACGDRLPCFASRIGKRIADRLSDL